MRSGVAHRRDFGVGHHDGLIGKVHGHQRAGFDAGWRITHDVLEAHLGQILQHLLDTFLCQGLLVARLRGSQHVQVLALLVLDEGLVEVGLAMDHINQVIDHAAFAAHDQVEVAQADVEVDHSSLVAAKGQAGSEAGAGGRLADAPFAGGHHDDLGHGWRSFQRSVLFKCQWDQKPGARRQAGSGPVCL